MARMIFTIYCSLDILQNSRYRWPWWPSSHMSLYQTRDTWTHRKRLYRCHYWTSWDSQSTCCRWWCHIWSRYVHCYIRHWIQKALVSLSLLKFLRFPVNLLLMTYLSSLRIFHPISLLVQSPPGEEMKSPDFRSSLQIFSRFTCYLA